MKSESTNTDNLSNDDLDGGQDEDANDAYGIDGRNDAGDNSIVEDDNIARDDDDGAEEDIYDNEKIPEYDDNVNDDDVNDYEKMFQNDGVYADDGITDNEDALNYFENDEVSNHDNDESAYGENVSGDGDGGNDSLEFDNHLYYYYYYYFYGGDNESGW